MNTNRYGVRFLSVLSFLLLFAINVFAQGSSSFLTPINWKDNETVILSKTLGMKRVYSEYNIKSGVVKEIELNKSKDTSSSYKLASTDLNPTYSPDSSRIAFTRNNDLYSVDIKTGKEIRYTFDGSNLILNGRASWVYYEEIFGRPSQYRAFWWSPDSKNIAFYRFDDSQVPMFPIFDSAGKNGSLNETRYPKAGDPNPKVKIGFVPAIGGSVIWADFDQENDQYFGPPYWSPSGASLFVQWMDRDQSNLVLYDVKISDGSKGVIYKEYQKTWVDWIEDIKFGKSGFYFIRDFDMWEQIYYQTYDGNSLIKLTEGKNWGVKFVSVDEESKVIYFTARREISTRNDFYKLSWDKKYKTKINRLSTGEYNYTSIMLSPDKNHFLSLVSNVSTPTKLVLMANGKSSIVKNGEVKVIADSKGTEEEFSKLPQTDMLFISTEEGFVLPASVIWPVNMDRTKKYPVLVSMYGGPNSGTVMDTWKNPGKTTQMWAEKGVIQISIDNRSSGHCGKLGMNYIYRNLGKYEIQDYISWAKYLKALPFVNGDKIGITGFSFGGTMTLLALTDGADYFKYGIAGGGVYDWTLYDSHYIERFMDLPKDNPEGYKNSSVLEKVAKYQSESGSLLYITHGTGDDNVHMQNTMQLIDALQKAGKHFELMLYPGGKHGYRGYQGVFSGAEDIRFWEKTLLR